ncbi:MAG: hypothetical protein K2M43_00730 [Mycoplasmoidaceae bacterium]|nr:hypothetical protein [Mycoplasmoidaceae bacterium]
MVFLSVGLFTVLKSTTTNIDGMYNTVSNEGNQHDFTVSELYEVGNIKLEPGAFEGNDGVGKSSDGQTVP